MSSPVAPAFQPAASGRFPALPIAVAIIAAFVFTTVWIHRSDVIVADDTAVTPSPSSMF